MHEPQEIATAEYRGQHTDRQFLWRDQPAREQVGRHQQQAAHGTRQHDQPRMRGLHGRAHQMRRSEPDEGDEPGLRDRGALREGEGNRARLLARYDRLARDRDGLRVNDDNTDGKLAVAVVSVLAERNADHIEEVLQKALANKGFSDRLVKLACEYVREQFAAEVRDEP